MSFIQKNLNTKLLFLLLLVAGGIAVLTLTYELSFTDINTKYENKVEELNETFNQLTQTQNIINRTKEELSLKTLREEDLSTQYTGLKETHEKTEAENQELEKTKTQLEQELLESQRETVTQKHEIEDLQQETSDLKDSVRNKLDEIDNLQSEVNRLRAQGCT